MEQANNTVSTVDINQQKVGTTLAPPMSMNTTIPPINTKLGDSINEGNSSARAVLECARRKNDDLEVIKAVRVGESGGAATPVAFSEQSSKT